MHVVLAAGGTAGHIFPAINTAVAISEIDASVRITILGTRRGLDRELVPRSGLDLELIDSVPFPRAIDGQSIKFPFKLLGAVKETRKFFKRERVTCVVGFGGYASAPAYLAARSLGLCMIVHEANATPGMANILGAKLTRNVALNHVNAIKHGQIIGMPVSQKIRHCNRDLLRQNARAYFDLPAEGPVLLVFGGSLGASSLNKVMADSISQLLDRGISVVHALGTDKGTDRLNKISDSLDPNAGVYRPYSFIDRMDLAYAAADLSINRGGAMTVAEITAVGIPSVFVPLPIGNGEQVKNAELLVASGAALMCDSSSFTQKWVISRVVPMMTDAETLRNMQEATSQTKASDAAWDLAQWALACGRE